MIYPDLPVEYWCKKHNLQVEEIKCQNCGLIQKTTIPFIAKECVGLVAPIHECGPDWQAGLAAPRDYSTRKRWADFVRNSIDGKL
jgi:hypothetical protein